MKKYSESIRTFLFLAIAAWLAFYLTSSYAKPLGDLANFLHMEPGKTLQDPRFMLPLLTPIIYLIERMLHGLISKIPWIHKVYLIGYLFDDKSMFVGTYLSFPTEVDNLNIFKIKFDSLSGKYKLIGYAYSLKSGRQVGDWQSENLVMKTAAPVTLSYVYEGERFNDALVRGHVHIKFGGRRPDKSENGYWIDVDQVGNADWRRSNYVKLTPEVRTKIIPTAVFMNRSFPFFYIRRFVHEPESIFEAYLPRKDDLALEFKRPDPSQKPRAGP